MGDTVGAGGVFSGGVAGRFFSSSLTARGRLAGASLSFSDALGGASSLCRGDERGRLLRLLSKSMVIWTPELEVLNFAGAGLILSAWSLAERPALEGLVFHGRGSVSDAAWAGDDSTSGGVLSWFCVFVWPWAVRLQHSKRAVRACLLASVLLR